MKRFLSFLWCIAFTACVAQVSPPPATMTVTPGATATPTVDPSTATPYPTATPPQWPEFTSQMMLPAPLYYESGADFERGSDCPLPHVTRVGPLGGSISVLGSCYLLGGLGGFDVSPVDGSIVIASQGALWILDADGENPTKLIDGLPNPEIAGKSADIKDPAWSPDGAKIAYADGGMRIVDVGSGERTDLIENECMDGDTLNTSYGPCMYGVWYVEPKWSRDSTALMFRLQNADYFYQMAYSLTDNKPPASIPGTAGVQPDNIAWSRDSSALLFDYWWPVGPVIEGRPEPGFMRVERATGRAHPLWPHGDRADPVYASAGNNPFQVRHPFETPDGRILFFQAEPCDSESCYKYALAEATPGDGGAAIKILRHNALPDGSFETVWHESGEYIAFVVGDYGGPFYVTVMRVSTGEMFVVATEKTGATYLKWGNP